MNKELAGYIAGLREKAIIDVMVREVPLAARRPRRGRAPAPARAGRTRRRRRERRAAAASTARGPRRRRRGDRHDPAGRGPSRSSPSRRPRGPREEGRPAPRSCSLDAVNEPSGFFRRVYRVVRRIPAGRVATYGQVAALAGTPRGARAVGWALRALDERTAARVPWHRVVNAAGGDLPAARALPRVQRRRLRAEGVRFRKGQVDLGRHGLRRLSLVRGSLETTSLPALLRPLIRERRTGRPAPQPRRGHEDHLRLRGPPHLRDLDRPRRPPGRDAPGQGRHHLPRPRGVGARHQDRQAAGHHPRGERGHPLPGPHLRRHRAGAGDRLQRLPLGRRHLRVRRGRPSFPGGDRAAHVHRRPAHGGDPPHRGLEPHPRRGRAPGPALRPCPRLPRPARGPGPGEARARRSSRPWPARPRSRRSAPPTPSPTSWCAAPSGDCGPPACSTGSPRTGRSTAPPPSAPAETFRQGAGRVGGPGDRPLQRAPPAGVRSRDLPAPRRGAGLLRNRPRPDPLRVGRGLRGRGPGRARAASTRSSFGATS